MTTVKSDENRERLARQPAGLGRTRENLGHNAGAPLRVKCVSCGGSVVEFSPPPPQPVSGQVSAFDRSLLTSQEPASSPTACLTSRPVTGHPVLGLR